MKKSRKAEYGSKLGLLLPIALLGCDAAELESVSAELSALLGVWEIEAGRHYRLFHLTPGGENIRFCELYNHDGLLPGNVYNVEVRSNAFHFETPEELFAYDVYSAVGSWVEDQTLLRWDVSFSTCTHSRQWTETWEIRNENEVLQTIGAGEPPYQILWRKVEVPSPQTCL